MRLTQEQIDEYDQKGFLVFHDLFSPEEIERAREEVDRLCAIETDHVLRETTGAVRMVFRAHDEDSPTFSPYYGSMSGDPRLLDPVIDVLGTSDLYIYHSKLNIKAAIDGAIWQWHQDYGYWQFDGLPSPEGITTFLVMLNDATELSGCLYFIPGSHKLGSVDPEVDDQSTSYKQRVIPKERMIEIMEECGDPVAVTGKPGTAVMFHANLLHGSGHNLGPRSRWHMYYVYNRLDNKVNPVSDPRPEYVCSRTFKPIQRSEKENDLRTHKVG